MVNKKIMFGIILGMFLISCVSAADWDNVADYKNEDKTVEITNWLGLGEKLGEATLTSHKDVNEVRRVGAGKDIVVMYYDFNFAEGYRGGLGDVKFYDMRNGKKEIEKDYHFVQEIKIPYNVSRMKEGKCKLLVNGSSQCDSVFSHYETMYRSEWVKLETNDIPSGNVRIGLATDVNEGDYLDGVWKIAGKYVTKHAEWTSGLDVDLYAYYKFEDNNESVNGIYNLSAYDGAPTFTTGLINNAGSLSDSNNFKIEDDDSVLLLNDESAMGFWVKPSSLAAGEGLIRKSAITGDVGWGMHQLSSGGIRMGLQWGNIDFSNVLYPDKWTFILINVNASSGANTCLYVNASLQGCVNTVSSTSTDDVEIGDGNAWSGNDYSGLWDEMGVWNRSLSQSEITQLWNDHSGITYTEAPTNLITITPNLDNPANDTKTTSTDLNFNSTISATNANVTNATLYFWNTDGTENYTDTNIDADGGNFSTTWDVINLADDTYLWNVYGCADNSTTGACAWNSTNYTFVVDSTGPVITFDSLTGTTDYHAKYTNTTLNWTVTDATSSVDSCWYEYLGTNYTVVCADKNTSINITSDIFTIKFFANDTLDNEDFNTTTWDYKIFQISEEYNDETVEGSTENFKINVTIGSAYRLSTPTLYYNNTAYTSTFTKNGDSYYMDKSLAIPAVTQSVNNTFYWSFMLDDSSYINSTSNQQEVINLAVDSCSSYSNKLYTLSLVDEETQLAINKTSKSPFINVDIDIFSENIVEPVVEYSNEFENENNATICISDELANSTLEMDTTIQYGATDYRTESYNIRDYQLTNATLTQNITLYDILIASSEYFDIRVKDSSFLPLTDGIITISRRYVGEGKFKTIEIPITDGNGLAIASLSTADTTYTINIIKDGEILATFPNIYATCQDDLTGECTITLNVLSSVTTPEDYTTLDNLRYNLEWDEDTRIITSEFSTIDGSAAEVTLDAIVFDGYYNETICNDTLTSSSGVLTCNVPISYTNQTIITNLYLNNELLNSAVISLFPDALDYFGYDTYIYAFLIMCTVPLMFISSPIGMVIGIMAGMLFSSLLLFSVGAGALGLGVSGVWLLVAAGIIIWKLSSGGNTT